MVLIGNHSFFFLWPGFIDFFDGFRGFTDIFGSKNCNLGWFHETRQKNKLKLLGHPAGPEGRSGGRGEERSDERRPERRPEGPAGCPRDFQNPRRAEGIRRRFPNKKPEFCKYFFYTIDNSHKRATPNLKTEIHTFTKILTWSYRIIYKWELLLSSDL